MIECVVCKEDVDKNGTAVLVNADGDFACSQACADKYKRERDHFFDHIIHNDHSFAQWLGVPVEQVKSDL
jgi:hypothetical protein